MRTMYQDPPTEGYINHSQRESSRIIRDDLDGIGSRVFWRLSGQQSSSGWLQATVPYKNAAMFEFRGIVGNGNRSDIGLDDLNPVSGKCDVTPPAARVEIPTTTSQPLTTRPTTGPTLGPGIEPHKETEATPTINTEPLMTGTTLTNVMRTEGQTGPEPLAITLGVLGGIVAVFLIVIAAWFITKRRSSSKLEIAALQNNMENPAYDPEGPGGDIVLREMEKKPVEMESRYHTFSPIVEANDGFENPTYASVTSPDDAGI